ncbi:DUF5994 family protein [Streptomyces sp. NPDC002564]|uniref:DUF5994 family protein n=1 Tax=Streptomyces sp. NPDC002564 TaxID=3364649 RepID=UPI0036808465
MTTPASPATLTPLTRLTLAPSDGRPHRIDGVWRPRTTDLVAELPRLLQALPSSWSQIAHVTVNGSLWDDFPGRMLIANQVLNLHRGSADRRPYTICLLAPGRGRWDLQVVPPHAEETAAVRPGEGSMASGAGPS